MKFFVLFLLLSDLLALEIDEKLTTRFLKVSKTKKTVLVNRGLEDGLVVGDHAKFFLTSGVIARGVVVKSSPTRSIWALYRLIEPQGIYPDKVASIKISKAVTVTEDPTKSLYDRSGLQAGSETMFIGRGANQSAEIAVDGMEDSLGIVPDDQQELASMGDLNKSFDEYEIGLFNGKTLEVFGLLHLNNLTSEVDQGDGGVFNGKMSKVDFSLGLEKYFDSVGDFLKNISIHALVHSGSSSTNSIQGQQIDTSVFEYGLGGSWHFLATPMSYNRLIGHITASFGVGSVSDAIEIQNSEITNLEQLDGSSNFMSFGVGGKYYLKNGFGAKCYLDYYNRSESYEIENEEDSEETNVFTKTVSGPRIQFGLSYRF